MREGWTRVALGDICEINKGRHPLEKTAPGKYPLVGTAAEWRTSDTFDFAGQAVCIPMVSSTGHGHASLKRVHFVEGEFAVANIVAAAVTRDPSVVDGRYLHAYLQTYRDRLLVTLMQGTANVSLKVADLINVPVNLPPLDEQRRIVDLIGSLDATITATDTAVAKTEQARRAILADLVPVGDTAAGPQAGDSVSRGWSSGSLGDVVRGIESGSSLATLGRPPAPGERAILKISAIQSGTFLPSEAKAVGDDVELRAASRVCEGDLLVTRANTTPLVGDAALVPPLPAANALYLPDKILRLVLDHTLADPRDVAAALLAPAGRRAAQARATGTSGSMKNITQQALLGIPFLIPPLDEQRRIIAIVFSLDAEVTALKAAAITARAAQAGLLADLLSGLHVIPPTYDRLLSAA